MVLRAGEELSARKSLVRCRKPPLRRWKGREFQVENFGKAGLRTNFFPRRENPGISLQKLSKINLLFFKSYSNK
ncbi:MAG: hypothetical protein METHP_01623 [Methanoregula sp. SKADARSKE-2]|nr:MAG: hypothetical protein METHP_01623 [Methanoregula sp. SKADARSKE-2]